MINHWLEDKKIRDALKNDDWNFLWTKIFTDDLKPDDRQVKELKQRFEDWRIRSHWEES